MKQLSTKSIGSLMIATATVISDASKGAKQKQLERILQRHDRKGELRADILGLRPFEFKALQKHITFDEILRARGFKNRNDFWRALFGRLKMELRYRGWSQHKIDHFVNLNALPAV